MTHAWLIRVSLMVATVLKWLLEEIVATLWEQPENVGKEIQGERERKGGRGKKRKVGDGILMTYFPDYWAISVFTCYSNVITDDIFFHSQRQ